MITYKWIGISGPADYEALAKFVGGEYESARVSQLLRKLLTPKVKGVLIEQPYVDKDYRSTYYGFYAKRARPFSSHCVRLHFVGESVSFDEATLKLNIPDAPQGHYFGFVVLRPTLAQTIVRAVLDPDAVLHGETLYLTCARHKVHVLGHRLTVSGFPFAQQAADIAVCAQTACWAVLRHYSERWPVYKELLLYEVTKLGLNGGAGGLRSSRGLRSDEMERVLVEAGTYPLRVRQDPANKLRFQRELFAWLESGFPVIGMLETKLHAVALIGLSGSALQPAPAAGTLAYWSQITGVIVMDDNRYPYWVAPLDAANAAKWPKGFSLEDVSSFFVPLPERVTYPSAAVDKLAAEFAKNPPEKFTALEPAGCAIRYFVTTAAALRRFALENASAFPPELYTLYMNSELPQFVWIVELSSGPSAAANHVNYRVVVDATAARHEGFPVFFAHSDATALVISHANKSLEWIPFSNPMASMGRMPGDLRLVGP